MGDKTNIEIFGKRLKKVLEGFNTIKHYGLDEEILICWLQVKTRLNKKDIQLMLKSQEEFYNKLLSEDILDGLEDENN